MARIFANRSITRRSFTGTALAAGVLASIGSLSGCTENVEVIRSRDASDNGDYTQAASLSKMASTGNPLLGFAADASAVILSENANNTCFSPLSLYLCTALLGAGTCGATQSETLGVLRASSVDDLIEICDMAFEELENGVVLDDDSPSAIALANSIWADAKWKFTEAYLATASDKLHAEARTAKFGTNSANAAMSNWVAENTNNLLKPEFATTADTIVALINTVYFKDSWSDQFEADNTYSQTFSTSAEDKDTDFLHDTQSGWYKTVGECLVADRGFSATGAWMRFMLPPENVSPCELFENPDTLAQLLDVQLDSQADINWSIPKFKFDNKFELSAALINMGMPSAFSPSSDFDSMVVTANGTPSENGIYVGTVEQGTHIGLDEGGVEAAAYTAMMMKCTALPPEEVEVIDMNLNRPFAYAIMAGDNIPLFVGAVFDPTCE